MTVRILVGDCRDLLKTLPDESVHCVVTSPPYFGLRDYGVAGQIGLEPTPDEFVAEMVAVFRAVRRVLRDDGTLWLNLGDSYSAGGRGSYDDKTDNKGTNGTPRPARTRGNQLNAGFHETARQAGNIGRAWVPPPAGFKPKDLLGIPWMIAFALRNAGWYLRQDIIRSKPNPMPESVRDRCTKAHEYLFLLTKSERYWYDADAISEPVALSTVERLSQPTLDQQHGSDRVPGKTNGVMKAVIKKSGDYGNGAGRNDGDRHPSGGWAANATRNRRSVWEVTTQPFSEAHFATFPPALIEPCIKAGCPEGGIVLDPFGGAGTTGLVADRLQRNAILLELNPIYAAMAERRIKSEGGMLCDVQLENLAAKPLMDSDIKVSLSIPDRTQTDASPGGHVET